MNNPNIPIPDYPPLTGSAAKAAIAGQLSYPQVVRMQRDMPVPQQSTGLISFVFFKEPKLLKNGKPLLGFFKLRGNWCDPPQAVSMGSKIVTDQDSKHPIKVVDVGAWLPLAEDGVEVKESVDVKTDMTEQDKMKELAMKEEEDRRKRIMRELKERAEEVKNAPDYNDDPQNLDFYSLKRNAWKFLGENIDRMIDQVRSLQEKRKELRKLLADLDKEHPTYTNEWIEHVNVERRKAGLPDYIPSENEQELYISALVD